MCQSVKIWIDIEKKKLLFVIKQIKMLIKQIKIRNLECIGVFTLTSKNISVICTSPQHWCKIAYSD